MSLKDVAKHFESHGAGEVNESYSLMQRIRHAPGSSAIGANFRKFGPSFGTYDFEDFLERAHEFFQDAMESDDPKYSRVDMGPDRVGIDYNGEIRGMFTRKGKPLAFFRPDFHQLGYASRSEELAAFRAGRALLPG